MQKNAFQVMITIYMYIYTRVYIHIYTHMLALTFLERTSVIHKLSYTKSTEMSDHFIIIPTGIQIM